MDAGAPVTTGSRTIADLLSRAAGLYAERVAFQHKAGDGWATTTYAEVGEAVSEIGRGLLDTVPSASKSGSLDRLRSDVGIIYTRRGRIAMAITVDDMETVQYVPDNRGLLLIWRLSQILQNGLAK